MCVCVCGYGLFSVCMCEFCNVWMCVSMDFVICGCVYVWFLYCMGICMYDFLMYICVYVWVL